MTTHTAPSAQALKARLEALPPGSLPLHRATTQGGQVDDSAISVSVLSIRTEGAATLARVGVFFTEVVGGCNCHDDPVEATAYAQLEVRIDAATGAARFTPLDD